MEREKERQSHGQGGAYTPTTMQYSTLGGTWEEPNVYKKRGVGSNLFNLH